MTTHCKIASRRWMFNSKILTKSTIATQPERVRQMFGSIARRYDLANHMLSCGADFYWRNRAAQIVAGWKAKQIVDLAAGTGAPSHGAEKRRMIAPSPGLKSSRAGSRCCN